MIRNDRLAKKQDTDNLHQRFKSLEQSHLDLRRTLGSSDEIHKTASHPLLRHQPEQRHCVDGVHPTQAGCSREQDCT